MSTVLILLAAALLCTAAHNVGFVLSALGWRIPVREFTLGMGPQVLRRSWRKTEIVLRLIPLGGYVKFAGQDEESGDPRPETFEGAPGFVRALIALGGPLATFLVACAILGASEAVRSLGRGMLELP